VRATSRVGAAAIHRDARFSQRGLRSARASIQPSANPRSTYLCQGSASAILRVSRSMHTLDIQIMCDPVRNRLLLPPFRAHRSHRAICGLSTFRARVARAASRRIIGRYCASSVVAIEGDSGHLGACRRAARRYPVCFMNGLRCYCRRVYLSTEVVPTDRRGSSNAPNGRILKAENAAVALSSPRADSSSPSQLPFLLLALRAILLDNRTRHRDVTTSMKTHASDIISRRGVARSRLQHDLDRKLIIRQRLRRPRISAPPLSPSPFLYLMLMDFRDSATNNARNP
jgi:hypothetical protein